MIRPKRSLEDVYLVMLDRLGAGVFPLGSRLPTCRALAQDLDSNPSTVSRAIRRLAAVGLVRTEERRGTFVTATLPTGVDTAAQMVDDLTRIVSRAIAAGYDATVIGQMFDQALAMATSPTEVAFAECNVFDLDRMSEIIENATGIAVNPVLLDDLAHDWNETFDVVAVPLFHLADVAAKSPGLDRVVELNFVPTADALRRIATLDPGGRVVVALPTERGIERVSSLVRQYYRGHIETRVGDFEDIPDMDPGDVLVTTNALGLSEEQQAALPEVIQVDWELDQHSAQTFKVRIEEALTR